MGEIYNRFASAFRPWNTDGVPASGPHKPVKHEICDIPVAIEAAIAAVAVSGTDPAAAAALVAPLVQTAQAARDAAETASGAAAGSRDAAVGAERNLAVAIASIPTTVASQLGAAVATATTSAVTASQIALSCPLLSGPSTMRVWIKEGTTNACEKAQAGRDHREAA
jgi:hypothetical protein